MRLPGARWFSAKVLGKDPRTDLALIRLEGAGDVPVILLGDSSGAFHLSEASQKTYRSGSMPRGAGR